MRAGLRGRCRRCRLRGYGRGRWRGRPFVAEHFRLGERFHVGVVRGHVLAVEQPGDALGQALGAFADGGMSPDTVPCVSAAGYEKQCTRSSRDRRRAIFPAARRRGPGRGVMQFLVLVAGGGRSGRPRRACGASAANSGRAVQSMRKPVEKIRKSSANSPLGVVTRISSSTSARSCTPQPRLKRAFGWRDTRSVPRGGGTWAALM